MIEQPLVGVGGEALTIGILGKEKSGCRVKSNAKKKINDRDQVLLIIAPPTDNLTYYHHGTVPRKHTESCTIKNLYYYHYHHRKSPRNYTESIY